MNIFQLSTPSIFIIFISSHHGMEDKSFALHIAFCSYACSISAGASVLITGGHSLVTLSTVTRYSARGLEETLPDLNSPRHSHGCTSYVNADNQQVRGKEIK